MLNENTVVLGVCRRLEAEGYTIWQQRHTKQRGTDIIAVKGAIKIAIEAKGATSATEGTPRYKNGFSRDQVNKHVANAFYTACKLLADAFTQNPETIVRVGIALPDTAYHRHAIEVIHPIIEQLHIALFWVKSIDDVEIDSVWAI